MLHVITTYSDGRELSAKYTPGAAPLADQIAFERYYRKPITVMQEYREYSEYAKELKEQGKEPQNDEVPLAEHMYFMVFRATLREHAGAVPADFDEWAEVVTAFEFHDDEADEQRSPDAASDEDEAVPATEDPTRPAGSSSKSRRSRSRPA